MKPFWSQHHATIIAMRADGATLAAMGEKLGVSASRVGAEVSRMRRSGVFGRVAPTKNTRIEFSSEMDACIRRCVDGGMSFKDCAAQVGVTPTVIQRRARELDIRSDWCEEIAWESICPVIVEMRDARITFRTIARHLGISDSSARRVAASMGLPLRFERRRRPKKRTRPAKPPLVIERFWNEDRVAKLAALVMQGKTFTEVAAEIGGISRNAVNRQVQNLKRIGAIDVVALSKRKVERAREALARGRQTLASRPAKPPKQAKVKAEKAAPALAASRKPLPSFSALAAERDPVTIIELEPGMCRWPYGDDGEVTYCGCRISLGSYCPAHAMVAYSAGKIATVSVGALVRS